MTQVRATYPWPIFGPLEPRRTALIVIDMQVDFCAPGGWVDQLGEPLDNTRSVIEPVCRLLDVARKGGLTIIHTRECHRPDLSDLNANKKWRSSVRELGIGDLGVCGRVLVQGEDSSAIVPELAPEPGEIVLDKPGKSAFFATEFDNILRARAIDALILAGVTSDCCVQATFRDASDRGYDALLVRDATAAVDDANHAAMLASLEAFGGRWGALAALVDVETALASVSA
ncbi:MAG: isochorismatase family cysteine hydrolase [Pseudomonadota bacterium]